MIMLKSILPLFIFLAPFILISQENLELLVVPNTEAIHPNTEVEFQVYLVNNGTEKISIPLPMKMGSMPKKFVYQNILLINEQDSVLNSFKCGTRGPIRNKRMPASSVRGGRKVKLSKLKYTFKDTGSYTLKSEYSLNGQNKPEGSSIDYKTFKINTTFKFKVVEKKPIPFVKKDIDYKAFTKAPTFDIESKIYDSTNVYKLTINNEITKENIETIKKLKNIRGVYISVQEPINIPQEIFELDLYEFSVDFHKTNNKTIDLSQLTQFKSLIGFRYLTRQGEKNNVILPEDLSDLEKLEKYGVAGVNGSITFPKLPKNIRALGISYVDTLTGVEGDFSEQPRLGKLELKRIDNIDLPETITGNIYRLSFYGVSFQKMPNLSGLTLAELDFTGYSGGELPDYFIDIFKNGSVIYFPKHLEKSKAYRKLSKRKLKNRVILR